MEYLWQAYPFLNRSDTQAKPLTGISACLCGDPVRYDGRSKWQPQLVDALEKLLRLEKFCPEVAIGMGTPRPPIHLCNNSGSIQAVGVDDPQRNVTTPLKAFADEIITRQHTETTEQHLCGYLFKSRSPSCGVGSTPLYRQGKEVSLANGIVAQRLKRHLSWLPVVDESALESDAAVSRFIFLNYLTSDFLSGNRNTLRLHEHHWLLHRGLPQQTQAELEALAAQPQSFQPYLSTLVNALLIQPLAAFEKTFAAIAQA